MGIIILASSSKRRAYLLENAGIPFEVVYPKADEDIDLTNPYELVSKLSILKAESVAYDYPNRLVIGADTIVYADNKVLTKPISYDEAYKFLNMLSDSSHKVITGFSLVNAVNNYAFTDYSVTNVYVDCISNSEIRDYLNREDVFDAAGSYKIQGLFSKYISKIDGCYNNVVGLPVSDIYKAIKKFNIVAKENVNLIS